MITARITIRILSKKNCLYIKCYSVYHEITVKTTEVPISIIKDYMHMPISTNMMKKCCNLYLRVGFLLCKKSLLLNTNKTSNSHFESEIIEFIYLLTGSNMFVIFNFIISCLKNICILRLNMI